ncbi:MAG TPA: hypothetical protein VLU46_01865, partial [Thermoanaerobaculia bacterium]|nr:hypothetical protein [Thermoanaerobaculia bacterium]
MRTCMTVLFLAIGVAAGASAQTAELRNLVAAGLQSDVKAVEAAVTAAYRSDDPAVRTLAARIATVRRLTNLTNLISSFADREANAEAAREELRTMVLLGGKGQVERAFYISDRFSKRLDTAVATAAAHLGGDAIDSYFTSLRRRNVDPYEFFLAALWNKPQLASPLAARLLSTKDKDAFFTFLYILRNEPRLIIDDNTIGSALADPDPEIRAGVIWFLVDESLKPSALASFDDRLKQMIAGVRVPRDNAEIIAGVELLRRGIGLPRREFIEFRYSLANEDVQFRLFMASMASAKIMNLFSDAERRIVAQTIMARDADTTYPPFIVPSTLPAGTAAAIMDLTGCREGWIGTARITVDDNGIVTSRDLSAVQTSDGCRRAVDMMLQYSLADNFLITAPRQADVSVVRAANGPICYDEERVATVPTAYVYGTPAIRMPRIKRTVAPVYPAGVPKTPVNVVVETMVTARGCVRAVRLVKPAANAALNG